MIKEVPVEKVVEKTVVKEVPVERVAKKEVIKEVPVEKLVEKEAFKEVPDIQSGGIHKAEGLRGHAEGGHGGQGDTRVAVQGSPGPRVSPGQAMLRQSHGSGVILTGWRHAG